MYTGHRCFGRFPHDVQMERDRCCKQDDGGRRSRTTGSGYVVCSRRQRVIGRQHGDRSLQDHYDYLIFILRPSRRSDGDTEEPGRERGDDTMTQHESTRIETTEAAGQGPGRCRAWHALRRTLLAVFFQHFLRLRSSGLAVFRHLSRRL